LFIPIYPLSLPFQHNLCSCLCDLKCFARGRFTSMALYFISPEDGVIRVHPINCYDTCICLCNTEQHTDCGMHRLKNLRLQTSGLLCWFDVSNIQSHRIHCSLINIGEPQLDIMRLYYVSFVFLWFKLHIVIIMLRSTYQITELLCALYHPFA